MRMYHGLVFAESKSWAVFRLVLGCLQMFGAVFSLTLFLWLGVHRVAVCSMIATAVLTSVSLLLLGARPFASMAANSARQPGKSESPDQTHKPSITRWRNRRMDLPRRLPWRLLLPVFFVPLALQSGEVTRQSSSASDASSSEIAPSERDGRLDRVAARGARGRRPDRCCSARSGLSTHD
jgi:hypothetical protein